MQASTCVARIGGLPVALGLGVSIAAGSLVIGWASPAGAASGPLAVGSVTVAGALTVEAWSPGPGLRAAVVSAGTVESVRSPRPGSNTDAPLQSALAWSAVAAARREFRPMRSAAISDAPSIVTSHLVDALVELPYSVAAIAAVNPIAAIFDGIVQLLADAPSNSGVPSGSQSGVVKKPVIKNSRGNMRPPGRVLPGP